MNYSHKVFSCIVVCLLCARGANAQENILDAINNQPNFGLYQATYFATGVPTNKEINENTADAKFQISIRHRLTKTVLPFNTLLMLTYTQKSFWDFYAQSAPFAENDYNPGLTFGKPIIANSRLVGLASLGIEHESNGLAGEDSRGWNFFILRGTYFFTRHLALEGKFWYGWFEDNNPDLLKYRGYGSVALNYRTANARLWFSAIVNPRDRFRGFNTQLEANFKLSKKSNQYAFVQWYNGYGENLLDYNRYTSMVRVGFCLKPHFNHFFDYQNTNVKMQDVETQDVRTKDIENKD